MLAHLKPHRLALARTAFALLSTCLLAACATAPPAGPPFSPAPEPGPGRARLYVFRIDPQHSLSTVEIAIEGQPEGRLRNGEYATFELAAGSHRVDFRQRGLAFASWGWNRDRIRADSGETIYIEISVRVSAQPMAGSGRDLQIAGRDLGTASENVFLQRRSETAARKALAGTTLRVP
jgi:predicted small secreted protein